VISLSKVWQQVRSVSPLPMAKIMLLLVTDCCFKFGCQINSVKIFFNKPNNGFWSQKYPPKPVSAVKKNSDEQNSFAIYVGKQLAIF